MDGPIDVLERSQRGRVSPYREWYAAEAESLCRRGATTAHLAAHFGVHERTIRSWAVEHPEFRQALERGRAAADGVDRAIFKLMWEGGMRAITEYEKSAHEANAGANEAPSSRPSAALKESSSDVTLKGEIAVLDRLSSYRPYLKQADFHALGATKRERLLMAANRVGKTQCGAAEMAMHLTGRYPDWWVGKRFAQPVRAWAAGITSESSRDVVQAKLIGPPERTEAWGTGFIPPDCVSETFLARSVAHAIDTVSIEHVSGGFSSLQFKSYEKGREKWQGTALEVVWFDEEPPLDIYLEGLTRTNETGGIVFVTFTPVLGHTDVVNRFLREPHDDRAVVGATIFDAGHFSAGERERIIASYPAHQRDARVKGIPVLGTGHVFPVNEESIRCEPFAIPTHWAQINGLDFGWDHPFGAVNCAWDRDADVFYVCKEYRERETTPLVHAGAVKPWGDWVPCAWPHDGLQHDKGSGEELARAYRVHGLNMLSERATFEDGTNGVEAGVLEMLERMQTGRWKVFSNLSGWLEEFRLYHREGGRIVKVNDDLISASRYAYMMRRFASTRPRRNYEPPPRGAHGWMK